MAILFRPIRALIEKRRLKRIRHEAIRWVMESQGPDGYFAPPGLIEWAGRSPAHLQAFLKMLFLDHRLTQTFQAARKPRLVTGSKAHPLSDLIREVAPLIRK